MTHEEILKEYLKDYPYVERKSGYDISKFRSDFYHKSRQTYPYSKVYEYKVPASLNRYLYVLVADSKKELANPRFYCYGILPKDKSGYGPFLIGSIYHEETGRNVPIYYTQHFFERFGQRALGKSSASWIENAKEFIKLPRECFSIFNNTTLSINPERYKRDCESTQTVFLFDEGLVFSDTYEDHVVWTSFISYDMLYENQINEITRQVKEYGDEDDIRFFSKALNGKEREVESPSLLFCGGLITTQSLYHPSSFNHQPEIYAVLNLFLWYPFHPPVRAIVVVYGYQKPSFRLRTGQWLLRISFIASFSSANAST